MEDGKYAYSEWKRCIAISWVVLVVSVVLVATGFFANVILFAVGLLGVSLMFPLVFSFGRYSQILLSDDRLVVGQDTVAIDDLDAESGARPPEQALTPRQRQQLDVITPRRYQKSDVAMLGGSWARPGGTELVVIKRKNGRLEGIATRHRDELMDALNRVLSTRAAS